MKMNDFINNQGTFGMTIAQKAINETSPADWWFTWGTPEYPQLRNIAIRILSQTTSSSNCERNWSTFSLIHTKIRNRLKYKKLHKLVYIHYNMRLRLRQTLRHQSHRDLANKYNPINLDYIFDEDDPLAPWLEERERPVLDGQDTSWLGMLSDDDDDPGGRSGTGTAHVPHVVPIRVRDDDDDNDDDDDDDDDDDTGGPPGFGSGPSGDAGGHSGDYGYTGADDYTPVYDQYGGALGRGSGGTSDVGASGGGGGGRHHDKGKNIVQDREEHDIGQIGGNMSSLYLHGHDYGHIHYPVPSNDSSINSSRYSMDYGHSHRYADYGQSYPYPHQDMGSQLATSLFGGSYGHYQQQQDEDQDLQLQDPPRKSFWW